jgi:hypothetical protein
MNINLEPKYEIGQKINKEIYIDNNLAYTRELYVSNIYATFDFKKNKIFYDYKFRCVEDDYVYEVIRI